MRLVVFFDVRMGVIIIIIFSSLFIFFFQGGFGSWRYDFYSRGILALCSFPHLQCFPQLLVEGRRINNLIPFHFAFPIPFSTTVDLKRE